MNKEEKVSKNERAGKVCGFRPEGTPIDFPVELDYICPENKKHFLEWSEYCYFLYCEKCNFDYPTPLCTKDYKTAAKVYLDILEEIKK